MHAGRHSLAGVLLLALDTSTPAVTVAVADDSSVLAESTVVDARRHGELLAPAIRDVLAAAGAVPADLTGVAVGVGPGPFTGLRVGIVTARALGAALGRPVHSVCSHDALAYATGSTQPLLAVTDARRREVYWARYADARTRVEGPGVASPAELAARFPGVPAIGAGAQLYPDVLGTGAAAGHEPAHPSAGALARLVAERLAGGGELLPPVPLYLRRPDAVAPGPRKRVSTA